MQSPFQFSKQNVAAATKASGKLALFGGEDELLYFIDSAGNKTPITPGPQGDSAYDVAVANGFVGTESQWLASLVGQPGTNGTNGEVTNASLTAALAPLNLYAFGAQTADKIVEGSGTVSPSLFRALGAATVGAVYVFTYLVKRAERTRVNFFNNGGVNYDVTVDLNTGLFSNTSTSSNPTVVVTPLNNDWFSVQITATGFSTASGNSQLRVYPASGGHPYTGNGTSGVLIQSATLSINGGANAWTFSEDFSNAVWSKSGCTVSANAGVYLGTPTLNTIPARHPLFNKKVTMLGTSLVAQNQMPPAFVELTGCVLQNLGVHGASLGLDARGSPHSGSGVITTQFASINADAEVIFLDMLVNDVAASDVPLGTITDTTTATYYGALANFFRWCRTNRPNASVCVVVQTSAREDFATGDYRHSQPNANGDTLEDFQNATRRICDYYGRPYIDPNRFGVGFLDMTTLSGDGLHWNPAGGQRVAEVYAAETKRFAEAGWI